MLRGVGEEGAQRENTSGLLLREFCERTGMVAINTWWPHGGGATFFTVREIGGRMRKYASRVDYVLIPAGEVRRIRECRVLLKEGMQLQNSKQALGYLIDHVLVRVLHEGLAVGEMMNKNIQRRRLDREGMAWEAQKGGERRNLLAQAMREIMTEQGFGRMINNGQGAAYDQIAEHMWRLEGEKYGIKPGDHKYGKETSEALRRKRQARGRHDAVCRRSTGIRARGGD